MLITLEEMGKLLWQGRENGRFLSGQLCGAVLFLPSGCGSIKKRLSDVEVKVYGLRTSEGEAEKRALVVGVLYYAKLPC